MNKNEKDKALKLQVADRSEKKTQRTEIKIKQAKMW